jgi:hypothetical protein
MPRTQLTSVDFATRLNRDCYCVGTDVPALHHWIEQDLRQHGITLPLAQTHPHLFSAVPVFVAEEHAVQMGALIAAVESVIALPSYQEAVLSRAKPVAHRPQAAQGVFVAYDFHLGQNGPQLIEINTNAGGAMLNAQTIRAQVACCPEIRVLSPQIEVDAVPRALFAMFQREWTLARGDAPLRRVAIVDDSPGEQYLHPEFLLFKRLFELNGVDAVIADPRELELNDGKVTYLGQDVDLIYNRLTDFYFENSANHQLMAAYLEDAVVMTPHPRSHALYANKRNLTILSDERELRAMNVGDREMEILLQAIPRTVAVADASAEFWWKSRKQWFFKPSGGFGSRGAYRGDKLTRKMFDDIMRGEYVAQSFVPPSERWHDQDKPKPLKLDIRCYVYAGGTQLMSARLYQGQTTNFRTEGGGFAPVYITSIRNIAGIDMRCGSTCA